MYFVRVYSVPYILVKFVLQVFACIIQSPLERPFLVCVNVR